MKEVRSDRVYHAIDGALLAVQAELEVAKNNKDAMLD